MAVIDYERDSSLRGQGRLFYIPPTSEAFYEQDASPFMPLTSAVVSNKLGPGPKGEHTLFSDMHSQRVLKILDSDPELKESLRFVLDTALEQLRRHADSLALFGMATKEFDHTHGLGPEHGKAIMERAWTIDAGGHSTLQLVQETLEL